MSTRPVVIAFISSAMLAGFGCGGDSQGSPPTTGAGGMGGGTMISSLACSDLFDQDKVRTYSIDITPDEWNNIQAEFNDVATLVATGNDFATWHPIVFRMGAETAVDATLKLHGQSSWAQTVMFDGDRQKMQFDISFHAKDPLGKFHGVGKLVFDMTRNDWTFMHDRLAHSWFRQVGIAAGCAANARVEINGVFYGLFIAEETTSKSVIQQFFPDHPDGDLWKGGVQPQTNQEMPDWSRQEAFAMATDMASVAAIVDLESTVREWAGEALLNNADGSYGGNHNFYIYDTGAKGFAFLPNDTDSTFDWLGLFEDTPFQNHPFYWWEGRPAPAPAPTAAWLAVINDQTWRGKYVDAIDAMLGQWNVGQLQGWIDSWSQQISGEVAADPHTWATPAQFKDAVAAARDVVAKRAEFLRSFVACERDGSGEDRDGDGVRWCDDCRDDEPAAHPGAAEVCGNGRDDDCDGIVDDGC